VLRLRGWLFVVKTKYIRKKEKEGKMKEGKVKSIVKL
jgi:hypothetical protein